MNKPDGPSKEICKALRKVGCQVSQISSASSGAGVPDLLVSYGGTWFLAEIKTAKGKLSDKQVAWHSAAKAPVYVIRSVVDAMAMLGLVS